MYTLPIANLTIDDVGITVVFADEALDHGSGDTRALYRELQQEASRKGLEGDIVLMWRDGGRTRFLAQPAQHAFLRIMKYDQLRAQVNGTLALL